MKARILPPEEWWKLDASKFPPFPCVPFDDIAVLVLEEGEQVVACATVFRATHVDGVWIDPEHRNPGVARRLMHAVPEVANRWGNDWAFAHVVNGNLERMMMRMGAVFVVPPTYIVPMNLGGKLWRPQEVPQPEEAIRQ